MFRIIGIYIFMACVFCSALWLRGSFGQHAQQKPHKTLVIIGWSDSVMVNTSDIVVVDTIVVRGDSVFADGVPIETFSLEVE